MKDKEIRWEHIKIERNGRSLFDTYCGLNSCCEECNKRVRFLCKLREQLKEHLTKYQEKIIKRFLDERG